MLAVQNDLCQAVDRSGGALLVLLDLSAAFDTLDHSLLLNRLHTVFGFNGKVLSWIQSYLVDRFQSIKINDAVSSMNRLSFGVPQGSVLGPLLFNMYTSPLVDIIQKHNIKFHMYADDLQLYTGFNPKSKTDSNYAVRSLESCLKDIRNWMTKNYLKLNSEKTEVIMVSTRHHLKNNPVPFVLFDGKKLIPSHKVTNLGVILNANLNMEDNVNTVCKKVNFHLRNIWKIRKYLNKGATEALIHALISSRIDYCNSLLFDIPSYLLQKLQRLQNSAARIIHRLSKYDHVSHTLYKLHWLPVSKRIQYKILVLVYKSLHGAAPSYLSNLIHLHKPTRELRSCKPGVLAVPKYHLKTFGERSFSVAAPKLWNLLPGEIRNCCTLSLFKQRLKTFLFRSHYTRCNMSY